MMPIATERRFFTNEFHSPMSFEDQQKPTSGQRSLRAVNKIHDVKIDTKNNNTILERGRNIRHIMSPDNALGS